MLQRHDVTIIPLSASTTPAVFTLVETERSLGEKGVLGDRLSAASMKQSPGMELAVNTITAVENAREVSPIAGNPTNVKSLP